MGNVPVAIACFHVITGLLIKSIAVITAWNRRSARSCIDVKVKWLKARNDSGGLFDIFVTGQKSQEVYCDTETDGGEWTVSVFFISMNG